MALVRGGYTVLPHVQRFADAIEENGWANSFGTYAGHDPTPERAVDIFVPVDDAPLAHSICQFGIDNQAQYGIWYIMSRQHIWNIERAAEGWRPQSPYDRTPPGKPFDVTANHYDHVHVSFYEKASEPPPPPKEDWLSELSNEEQRDLYNWVRDQQQYMSDEKDPAKVDTLLEAVAGVVNDTKFLASTATTQIISWFARFDPEYPTRKDIDIGRERLATILLKLDASGGSGSQTS